MAAFGMRLVGRVPRVAAALVPALVLLVRRPRRPCRLGCWRCGMPIRSVCPSGVGDRTWADVLQRSIVGQGDLFALGMIAAVVVAVAAQRLGTQIGSAECASWLGRSCIVCGVLWLRSFGSSENGVVYTLMAVVCASALLVLAAPRTGRGHADGCADSGVTLLRAAGLCSYSVYLWHVPVILFLREHVDAVTYDSFPQFANQHAVGRRTDLCSALSPTASSRCPRCVERSTDRPSVRPLPGRLKPAAGRANVSSEEIPVGERQCSGVTHSQGTLRNQASDVN